MLQLSLSNFGLTRYKLLGLQKYRYKATQADIEFAYKDATIKQHPDKKSSLRDTEADRAQADAYFTSIKKAYEQLSNPDLRRLYDSIDQSEEDDRVPNVIKVRFGSA